MMVAFFLGDVPTVVKILERRQINVYENDYQIFRELAVRPSRIIVETILSNYSLDNRALQYLRKTCANKYIGEIFHSSPFMLSQI